MTFFNSLNTSLLALKAHSHSLNSIASNIANSNTDGYKRGEVLFQDMFTNPMGGQERGTGLTSDLRQLVRREGQLNTSNRNLDISLSGRGLFVTSPLKEEFGNQDIELTDNGRFRALLDVHNEDGSLIEEPDLYLKDIGGNYVLGWPYNLETETFDVGEGIDSLSAILMGGDENIYEAAATTEAMIEANLDPDAEAISDEKLEADFFSYSIGLWDGQGVRNDLVDTGDGFDDLHALEITFTKMQNDPEIPYDHEWSLDFDLDRGLVSGVDAVQISFDETGDISRLSYLDGEGNEIILDQSLSEDPLDFSLPLLVSYEVDENATTTATDTETDGTDAADTAAEEPAPGEATEMTEPVTVMLNLNNMTQRGDWENIVINTETDGNPIGFIEDYSFDNDGVLMGWFTNEMRRPLYKLPIGDVIEPNNLTQLDDTHFGLNEWAGELSLYEADKTERGTFVPQSYETSTTDIGQEFTRMIEAQRAYSSAATSLRTADEMIQTLTKL